MTPKEKAEELFKKYCYAIKTDVTDSGYFSNIIYAKQCSLIAVDEILKANVIWYENSIPHKYWISVKKEIVEIEKL